MKKAQPASTTTQGTAKLMELGSKFGSLDRIPEKELSKISYKRVSENGCITYRPLSYEKPPASLLEQEARARDIENDMLRCAIEEALFPLADGLAKIVRDAEEERIAKALELYITQESITGIDLITVGFSEAKLREYLEMVKELDESEVWSLTEMPELLKDAPEKYGRLVVEIAERYLTGYRGRDFIYQDTVDEDYEKTAFAIVDVLKSSLDKIKQTMLRGPYYGTGDRAIDPWPLIKALNAALKDGENPNTPSLRWAGNYAASFLEERGVPVTLVEEDDGLFWLKRKTPEFLSSLAKRNKRIALAFKDPEDAKMLHSFSETASLEPAACAAKLREDNAELLSELKKLGINEKAYLQGIEPAFFSLKGDRASESEVRERGLSEVKAWLPNLVSGLHDPRILMQKISNATATQVGGTPEKALGATLEAVAENDDALTAYFKTLFDYAAAKRNVEDADKVREALFHIRNGRKIMKGEFSTEEQKGAKTLSIRHWKRDFAKDVSIGYDAGCCLLEDNMVDHLFDLGVQFTELYVGTERRGMMMMFTTEDVNSGEPLLVVNSIELSNAFKGYSKKTLGVVVDSMLAYVEDYAKACGFKGVLMGNLGHNTSMNYGRLAPKKTKKSLQNPKGDIIKLGAEPGYNEVFDSDYLVDEVESVKIDNAAVVWLSRLR